MYLAILSTCALLGATASARGVALQPEGTPLPNQVAQSPQEFVARDGLGENLPYPGADYAGVGYDIFKGNPQGDPETQGDPGFRQPVLALEWSQDAAHLTRDMQHLQPVGGYALPERSCQMTRNVEQQSSTEDYSKSLSVDASVEGSYDGFIASASFKASAGYSSFSRSVVATNSEHFSLRSYCLQYIVGLNVDAETKDHVLPFVASSIATLPPGTEKQGVDPEGDEERCAELIFPKTETKTTYCFKTDEFQAWRNFFNEFGTHVIREVHLGGKLVVEVTISESEMEKLSSVDVSSALSASLETAVGGGSVSVESSSSNSEAKQVATTKKNVNIAVFGGLPPKDNEVLSTEGFGEWAETVRDAPMPVRYKLLGLDKVTAIDHKAYHAALKIYANELSDEVPPALEDLPDAKKKHNRLKPGEVMEQDGKLKSPSGFVLDFDVQWGDLHIKNEFGNPIWQSQGNTWQKMRSLGNGEHGPADSEKIREWYKNEIKIWHKDYELKYKLVLLPNCDLQVIMMVENKRTNATYAEAPFWSTQTPKCGTPGFLKLQDDGDLVLKSATGKLVWHTGTAGGVKQSNHDGIRLV